MFGFNKRKKKICALEALIKSSGEIAELQKTEIKSLERANNNLMAENDKLNLKIISIEHDNEILRGVKKPHTDPMNAAEPVDRMNVRAYEEELKDEISVFDRVLVLDTTVASLLAERKKLKATITRQINKLRKLEGNKK